MRGLIKRILYVVLMVFVSARIAVAAVPGPPTALTAAVIPGAVDLRWNAATGTVTGYQVWRAIGANWVWIAALSPTTLYYRDTNVSAYTTYTYGMRAHNSEGVSAGSNNVTVATQSIVPTPPTNVVAQSVTPNSVSIRWGASSGVVVAYQVWRNSAATGWQRIADTAPTTLAYTDNTVTPSTFYQYGVRAHNAIGVSGPSNTLDVTTPATSASAYACPDCVQVKVGQQENFVGPTWEVDNPFNAINVGGAVRGYFGNETTLLYEGTAVTNLTRIGGVLGKGDLSSRFDSCGAWLNTAYVDGAIVRGWYHAETQCNYAINQTHKSIAYAESRDGGRTWVKPNYPNNQILTGVTQPTFGKTSGLGDHSVVRVGNYFYAYFFNADEGNWGVMVARAPVSSGGVPGSWAMYRNGAFNEPAYGGRPSILSTITGSAVSRLSNTELTAVSNPWMSLSYLGGVEPQKHQIWMSFSVDGLNWKRLAQPLVTVPDNVQIAYASLVHPTGGTILGNNFYLYYMYIPPGGNGNTRYLVRRRIEFRVYPTPITPQVVPF